MAISTHLSIITLNVNGLDPPIKSHSVAEWVNIYIYICYLQNTHNKSKDIQKLNVKRWKKLFHANGNEDKAGLAILI